MLRINVCVSETACPAGTFFTQAGCQSCPQKCATCSDINTCTSCAGGFVSTGADCVSNTNQLTPVRLQIVTVTRGDLVVFVQIQANILPNNLPSNLASQFLLFVPSSTNFISRLNIWVANGFIYVAITHTTTIPSYDAFLVLNSNVLDSIYRSMGYSTADAFVQTRISGNLPTSFI